MVCALGGTLDRGNLLKFEGKSWRLKEAAERLAKRAAVR